MKIKQTIFIVAILLGACGTFLSPTVFAAECAGVQTSILDCPGSQGAVCNNGSAPNAKTGKCYDGMKCGDGSSPALDTNSLPVPCKDGSIVAGYSPTISSVTNSGLWGILITAINILTAGIGIAAVGGIIYGSILYTSAGGNADQVKKAKDIIKNIVIGLVAYALMYSVLNFIIPGGIFTQ